MAKLLIVDDEIDVMEFAKNFFRKRGVNVSIAATGEEALRIIAAESPDLVLLDIRMEGMGGIEALRAVRQQGNAVRTIMISGVEDEGIVQEALALGVTGFIHKPLVLEELEKVVMAELSLHP
jgi:two-component system response regulator (stage 0 sporulation protein F)